MRHIRKKGAALLAATGVVTVTLLAPGAALATAAALTHPTTPPHPGAGHGHAAHPAQQTIWRGDFDSSSSAWTIETAGATGAWQGWTFTKRDDWFAAAEPQGVGCDPDADQPLDNSCFLDERNQFSRARGTLAVADNGIAAANGAVIDNAHPVSTALISPSVTVEGRDEVELVFASHYEQAHKAVARVTVSFDGGNAQEILRYYGARISDNGGGDVLSGQEVIPVNVPARAKSAVFRFEYTSNKPELYWALDDVLVRTPLAPLAPNAKGTTLQVFSDIQGEGLPYLDAALDLLHREAPKASAALIAGDIISGPKENGQEAQLAEYKEVSDIFAKHKMPPVYPAIGNHDTRSSVLSLGQQADNFIAWANRWGAKIDKTYYEKVIDGIPLIALGAEAGTTAAEGGVSDKQVQFLKDRLAYWKTQGNQVVVMGHYPFEWSVSGTYGSFYQNSSRIQVLEDIIGQYSNVVYISGHSHWSPYLRDWSGRPVTEGGDPDGFAAFNTGSLAMEFGPNPINPWDEDSMTDRPESPTVMTITKYDDRMIVRDFDVLTGEQIQELTVANPLAGD
ncbi:metallophosphoesterase family protein [Paenibacillus sp. GCM10023250]|uniref:metallophosphoesterase family protein n=1 Tax=Paenibacillus sp. GCM10023250 TaxID=3252648 RepID=UPI0036146ADC